MSPVSFERNHMLALAPEVTYNTYVSPTRGIRIKPGAKLVTDQGIITEPSARSIAPQSLYDRTPGLRGWTLTWEANYPLESVGHVLHYLLGTTVNTTVSTFTKHVFTVSNANPASFSARFVDDNVEWELSGGRIRTLTLRAAVNTLWNISCEMVGGTWNADSTLTAPTYVLPSAAPHFLRMEDGAFDVNSVAFVPESFEVTFTRNLADGPSESYALGSRERVRLESAGEPAAFLVTGFLRRLYDATTHYTLMNADTLVPIGYTFGVVDTAAYVLDLQFNQCKVEKWAKEGSSGIEMQRLDFTGYYAAAATDIQITTQDKDSTAPMNV